MFITLGETSCTMLSTYSLSVGEAEVEEVGSRPTQAHSKAVHSDGRQNKSIQAA